METVADFILLVSKITAAGDCSYEIKRHLLLGRKSMTILASILKSRDIADKGSSSQSYGFPVVRYGCELSYKESLSTEELMVLNCGVGQDSLESFGLQGDPTSPS